MEQESFSSEEIQEISKRTREIVVQNAGTIFKNEMWVSEDKTYMTISISIINFHFCKSFFAFISKRGDKTITRMTLAKEMILYNDWQEFCDKAPDQIKKEFSKN